MIKLKGLLNEGPQKVGNVNAFGASKVLGKGKKVLGFVPDTPNAVATLIQDFPQAMEIEFKQGFVYKGENHKSIKRGSGIWKELEKRFLDTATKDAMKAGFKMNEEVNENEVLYKVAGRPVTLIKGKKSNGLDWKVKFQNGKETLLANVITLINPFPPIK